MAFVTPRAQRHRSRPATESAIDERRRLAANRPRAAHGLDVARDHREARIRLDQAQRGTRPAAHVQTTERSSRRRRFEAAIPRHRPVDAPRRRTHARAALRVARASAPARGDRSRFPAESADTAIVAAQIASVSRLNGELSSSSKSNRARRKSGTHTPSTVSASLRDPARADERHRQPRFVASLEQIASRRRAG